MIHCYDFTINENRIFNSTKEAAEVLNIPIHSVQRGVLHGWIVDRRFLFDSEEISKHEIDSKTKHLPYYMLDVESGEIQEFRKLIDLVNFAKNKYRQNITYTAASKALYRQYSCYKLFFVSREDNFSFVKYHRTRKFQKIL